MTDIATRAGVAAIDGLMAVMVKLGIITPAQIDASRPRTQMYEILIVHLRAVLYANTAADDKAAMKQRIEDLEAQLAALQPELPMHIPASIEEGTTADET